MINLNKITAVGVKLIIFLFGLSIAVIPIIYIIGTEPLHTQSWQPEFQHISINSPILDQINNATIFNIYLKENSKSYNWADIKHISNVADYFSHEIQQKGAFVRRKFLEFKDPQAKKSKNQQIQIRPITHSQIEQTPIFEWLKNIIEPIISFEHDGYNNIHWIIVSMGELQSKIVDEIQTLKTQNPGYKFILVSLTKLKSKIIQSSTALIASSIPVKQEVKVKEPKAANEQKQIKDKKVTKQTKEVKQGKEPTQPKGSKQSKKSKGKAEVNKTIQQL